VNELTIHGSYMPNAYTTTNWSSKRERYHTLQYQNPRITM